MPPSVPMTPLTPVTLSLLTNQQNPGVQAYTPRTRGLHAELQSWLSPLLGDEEEQEPERKPPARLPSMDEQTASGGPVPTAWSEQKTSDKFVVDPLSSSHITAEAVLETLLLTVVDESDAKFKACVEGADLETDLEKLMSDCEKQVKTGFAQKQPNYADIDAAVRAYAGQVCATAAEHVAALAAGYDAARRHMRTFGVEHLLEVWAEAEASRLAKAALNARELTATIERVRESEDGAQEAARTAEQVAGEATNTAARLRAQVAQLEEKLHAEATRANAAESVLVKRFEQMDELSVASTSCSRRLLHKVEALEAAWKSECNKSNRLEIALRKLQGERQAQEAKRCPAGKEENPPDFAAKVKEMHEEVDEVRGRVSQIVEHQASIRRAIDAIRKGMHKRAATDSPTAASSTPVLAPSPPQSQPRKKSGGPRANVGGRQLSVIIPHAQAVGGSGKPVKRTPSWHDRPSVRGSGRSSGPIGRGNQVDAPGSGSAAQLNKGLALEGITGDVKNDVLASGRTRQPAMSLASSRRLTGQ